MQEIRGIMQKAGIEVGELPPEIQKAIATLKGFWKGKKPKQPLASDRHPTHNKVLG